MESEMCVITPNGFSELLIQSPWQLKFDFGGKK